MVRYRFYSLISVVLIVAMTMSMFSHASYGFFIDRKENHASNNSNINKQEMYSDKTIIEQIKDDVEKYGERMENEDFTYLSSDGSLLVGKTKNADGTDKFTVASKEEMFYRSDAEEKEGLTYVGTMKTTGVDIYKETYTDSEIESDYDIYREQLEEDAKRSQNLLDWANRDLMNDDEINNAIISANEFADNISYEYFEKIEEENNLFGSTYEVATYSNVATESEIEEELEESFDTEIKTSYVQIAEPTPIADDGISFITCSDVINDGDQNESLFGASEDKIGDHTTLSTEVLIVKKDKIYFTISGRNDDGSATALNGASVSLSYKKDNKSAAIQVSDVTRNINGKNGLVGFSGFDGTYSAVINITCPGYKSKTYFTSIIEGGEYYEYTLEKLNYGEIYLRGISIDGKDFLDSDYTLLLFDEASRKYDIKYIVDFPDQSSITDSQRQVVMRTVNVKPKNMTESESKIYRDKKFKSERTNYGSANGNVSYLYTIKAAWTERTHTNRIPESCEGFEDTSKTRFLFGDELYLDLPENLQWEDSKSNHLKTKLKVAGAKSNGDSNFTLNLLGIGKGGDLFSGTTDLPGLKKVSMSSKMFDLPVSLYYSKDGDAIGCYNVSGTLHEWINSLKEDDDLQKYPSLDDKWKKAKEVYNDFIKQKDKIKEYCDPNRNPNGLSKSCNGIKTLKAKFEFSAGFIFNYDKARLDIFGSAAVKFTGGITWYHFFGVFPVYGGFEGKGDVGVNFDYGLKLVDGKFKSSENAGVTFFLKLSFAIFAGAGIRGLLGVEGNGSVYFKGETLTAGRTKDGLAPYKASIGYNVSIKLNALFFNFDFTLLSDEYSLYPPKDTKYPSEDIKNGLSNMYGGADQENSEEQCYKYAYEGCQVIEPEKPEGSTLFGFNNNQSYGEKILLGDTLESSTTLVNGSVAPSTNLQYIGITDRLGAVLRIAYVSSNEDGITRVVPRVVVTFVYDTGVFGDTMILPISEANGKKYGYDYGFSGTGVQEVYIDGTGYEKAGLYLYVVINSGELDTGDNIKSDLMEEFSDRANESRLRVIGIDVNRVAGSVYSYVLNDVIEKTNITTDGIGQNYFYAGTPTIYANATYKETLNYSNVCFTHEYYVSSVLSNGITPNRMKSNGYMLARRKTKSYDFTTHTASYSNVEGAKFDSFERGDIEFLVDPAKRKVIKDSILLVSQVGSEPVDSTKVDNATHKTIEIASTSAIAPLANKKLLRTYCSFDDNDELIIKQADTQTYSEAITNLAHADGDDGSTLYYVVGDSLYCLRYTDSSDIGKISKITLKDDSGTPSEMTRTENSTSYYSYTINDQKMLNILTVQNHFELGGEHNESFSNASAIFSIKTAKILDDTNYKISHAYESVIDGRAVRIFAGGRMRKNKYDLAPGLKVYYLANEIFKEKATISETIKSFGKNDLCDLYVWNWEADWGAKLTSFSADNAVIKLKDTNVVPLTAIVENTGPKVMNNVTITYTTDIDDTSTYKDVLVNLNYGVLTGDTQEIKFSIPVEDSWDGYVRIFAAVTKVDGHDSNEAGFKPVWIKTEDIENNAKINYTSTDNNYNVVLNINTYLFESIKNKLRVKIYRELMDSDHNRAWETMPSRTIELPSIEESVSNGYNYNIPFSLESSEFWFGGFYKNDTELITSKTDVISKVRYEEVVTAVKFELCGYGDNTWNVAYGEREVENPVYKNLCKVEVDTSDITKGSITGKGYYLANDPSSPVKIYARPLEGYIVDKWYKTVGALKTEMTDKEGQIEIEDVPASGTTNVTYEVSFIVDTSLDKYLQEINVTKDELGVPMAEIYASIGEYTALQSGSFHNDTFVRYLIDNTDFNSKDFKVKVKYDKLNYSFKGWYASNSTDTGFGRNIMFRNPDRLYEREDYHEINALTSNESFVIPKADTDVPTTWRKGEITAVLEARRGHLITYEPMEGDFNYDSQTRTLDNGKLASDDLLKAPSRPGYTFDGWFTGAISGTQISQNTVFTKATTIYAHYTEIPKFDLYIRTNKDYHGDVVVDSITTNIYTSLCEEGKTFVVNASPSSILDFEFDNSSSDAWDVYTKDADGKWIIDTSITKPEIISGTSDKKFTMPGKDCLLVAKINKKTTSVNDIIHLDGDNNKDGYPYAKYYVSSNAGVRLVDNDTYSVMHNSPITIKASLSDANYFIAWKKFDDLPTYVRDIDVSTISETNPYTFNLNEDTSLYAYIGTWIDQNLEFRTSDVEVTYGIQYYQNVLSGNITSVVYDTLDHNVATVSDAGKVYINSIGTTKVKAKAIEGKPYREKEIEYTITVNRKDINDRSILVMPFKTGGVAIIDNSEALKLGIDYKINNTTTKGDKKVYTIEGIGNYKGTRIAESVDEGTDVVLEINYLELNENIPAEQYDTAMGLLSKSVVSGFNKDVVDTSAIKTAVEGIGDNKIAPATYSNAKTIIISSVIDVILDSIDNINKINTYTIEPHALVTVQTNDNKIYNAHTPIDNAWFKGPRNITITLATQDTSHIEPNLVIHKSATGSEIERFTLANSIADNTFVYDRENAKISFKINHFSSFDINYRNIPNPTPSRSSGGGGGGGKVISSVGTASNANYLLPSDMPVFNTYVMSFNIPMEYNPIINKILFPKYDINGLKSYAKMEWVLRVNEVGVQEVYLTDANGYMITGFANIADKIYYFSTDNKDYGQMKRGFTRIGENDIYFDSKYGYFADNPAKFVTAVERSIR